MARRSIQRRSSYELLTPDEAAPGASSALGAHRESNVLSTCSSAPAEVVLAFSASQLAVGRAEKHGHRARASWRRQSFLCSRLPAPPFRQPRQLQMHRGSRYMRNRRGFQLHDVLELLRAVELGVQVLHGHVEVRRRPRLEARVVQAVPHARVVRDLLPKREA
eukprot:CAMPEP_0113268384 /NCGR_PEP_ID=MMETSP0008_2-20120614/21142_1 /TAXON_ID=97485 /ORGANISM="Prymnesium parvum" /LENGTH=162 /DNA_ID=CAMNT_0000117537 /DNA_START=498 /DNA_END=984 /DNA_ORIENTATION=+ /assembly_acc=CAM_ASM_000153